jgi:hypothetical protein
MKALFFYFLLFLTTPLAAQQVLDNDKPKQTVLLRDEATLLSKEAKESLTTPAQLTKPNLQTAQYKILWNRPVSENPNYLKVMPLRDPDEVVIDDAKN